MFLKFIKELRLKKNIKFSLSKYKPLASPNIVVTVGILIDETYFASKEALIQELVDRNTDRNNIQTLSFVGRAKKGREPDYCCFTNKDIDTSGTFIKQDVIDFINTPFDLLISYYDVQKAALVLATIHSKAKFKTGFATIDTRLNTFIISSQAEKYKEFVDELFKYLKILNKI
jgi:AcrR family transcriptional regulator